MCMWGEIITTKISRDEINKKTLLQVCTVFLEINPTTVLLSFLHSKPLKRNSIRLGFQPSASHSWALCASLLVLFHLCLIFKFLHIYKIYTFTKILLEILVHMIITKYRTSFHCIFQIWCNYLTEEKERNKKKIFTIIMLI